MSRWWRYVKLPRGVSEASVKHPEPIANQILHMHQGNRLPTCCKLHTLLSIGCSLGLNACVTNAYGLTKSKVFLNASSGYGGQVRMISPDTASIIFFMPSVSLICMSDPSSVMQIVLALCLVVVNMCNLPGCCGPGTWSASSGSPGSRKPCEAYRCQKSLTDCVGAMIDSSRSVLSGVKGDSSSGILSEWIASVNKRGGNETFAFFGAIKTTSSSSWNQN